MSDERWLVLFDTDHIKHYLFATNKLKEIRGASRLLEELNTQRTVQVAHAVCPEMDSVYADGGGALFLVPSETAAHRIIDAVEKLYRLETLSATITGECLPLAPATETQGFGQRVQELSRLLRRAKARKAAQPGSAVLPYLQLCDACGQHPASVRSTDEEGLPRMLCQACDSKRAYAPGSRTDEPEDFSKLGELAIPVGYLGFIYADGNCIGKRLENLPTRSTYVEFSQKLRDWLRHARDIALAGDQRDGFKPYIELLLGGDDLLLVTAADLALPAALKLAQEFELVSNGLTLAAGVILAHADYPVAELLRLAELRLKHAKACSFKAGYRTGAIDFEVVTSAAGQEPDTETAYQNRRPYLLEDLAKMLEQTRALHHFPTSQLQAMYESLHVSPQAASITSMLSFARASKDNRQKLHDFFRWSGSLAPDCLPPWCEPGQRITALGDVVELLPFVPERS